MNTVYKGASTAIPLSGGDMVIHFSASDAFSCRHRVSDFWVMEREARLTITSHSHELPPGILLHGDCSDPYALWMRSMHAPDEVCPPNCWKVRAGDYLALARRADDSLSLIALDESAAVYWLGADGAFPDPLAGMASPDSPDPRHAEQIRRAAGEVAARPMLRSFAAEWIIGP